MKPNKLPPCLWRLDDGAKFSLNSDGATYSLDGSGSKSAYRHTYEHLMETRLFSLFPLETPRVDSFLEAWNQAPELKRLIRFARGLELELAQAQRELQEANPG